MTKITGYSLWALRNGVRFKELQCVKAPRINVRQGADIKSSFAATFINDDSVDLLSDTLQPFLISNEKEQPLGVFRVGTAEKKQKGGVTTVSVSAYDKCYDVRQNATTTVLHFSKGSGYLQAIKSLLSECGISLIINDPCDYEFQTDREDWSIGTRYLTIVNTLLSEINFQSLWFNANGAAMILKKTTNLPSNCDFFYSAKTAQLLDELTSTIDYFEKPNVFVAICSNPDLDGCLYSVAVNDSLSSPFSTTRRGLKVVETHKVNNIASQEALNNYASSLCYDSMLSSEIITIGTDLEAEHGIGSIIALDYKGHQGLYVEEAWSMTLGADQTMKHTLRRVVYG